jgi:hypothetical protein
VIGAGCKCSGAVFLTASNRFVETVVAAGNAMSPEERRQHQRKLVDANAQIADLMGRSWMAIHLLDISQSGIAFVTDEEVAIDDIRTIEFSLPGSPDRVRCEVRVANMLVNRLDEENAAPGKYRVGAAFERIDARDVASIERFVEE